MLCYMCLSYVSRLPHDVIVYSIYINSIVVYVATVKVHIMLSIIYCTLSCGAHEYAIVCIEHTHTHPSTSIQYQDER